ncbi:hypothetical protein [Reichenbachiella ulvae]|uniref:DUF3887 domain-containing protein n=1 Tax=Reichenbachiella ulvae TaxID=2980104 RepID=A0ABT3D0M5_9BACT|nr:hypothetical protein [Reichenbachiella ulvae]MCV9389369.1 hypothetical protein [Reichenbachiella ulvae]
MRQIILIFAVATFYSCTTSSSTNSDKVEATDIKNTASELKAPISLSYSTIALKFINAYVDNANKMSQSVEMQDWVNSSDLVSNDFRAELDKIIKEAFEEDPEYGLGFDPIFDAQDYPEEGLVLLNYDSTSNIATVRGKQWEAFLLNIRMTNQNGQVLVDGCGVVNIPLELRAKR